MKQRIGSYDVELLTADEVSHSMAHAFDAYLRERYRGIDYLEFTANGGGAATYTFQGPETGYVWSLKMVSVVLSASGSVLVFPGSSTGVAPLAAGAAQSIAGQFWFVTTWGSDSAIIKQGRAVTIQTSSTGGLGNLRIMAEQVPAEMIGKL